MTKLGEQLLRSQGHQKLMTSARISALVKAIDRRGAGLFVKLFSERAALMIFQYHGLFASQEEIRRNLADPQQGITVEHFRHFIEYFLHQGYTFVSIADILKGLPPGRKYALITFDDGYFNNWRALTSLDEYDVPAAFFISAYHVRDEKAFWWDVVYRERTARGVSPASISGEVEALKMKSPEDIDAYLRFEFGPGCLKPAGDLDRPFNLRELSEFARNRHVDLGNHTCNHVILAKCSPATIAVEVGDAQRFLCEITGAPPASIVYPNGDFTSEVIAICKSLGLRLGFSSEPGKNILPIDFESEGAMTLRRFGLWGRDDLIHQYEWCRSDLLLHERLVRLRKALTRRLA